MHTQGSRAVRAAFAAAVAIGIMIPSGLAVASNGNGHGSPKGAAKQQVAHKHYAKTHSGAQGTREKGDDGDLADQQDAYSFERTAPATAISGGALDAAVKQASSMHKSGGAWSEVTTLPYNGQPSNYTDPFWGNAGAGFSIVGGRTTALTVAPDGTWFAGTADGGVWTSNDQGQHWTPTFDSMPTLSIGALAVNPVDGSVWVGTGEANTNQDSYAGTGIYRTTNDGASYQRVGDDGSGNNPLVSHSVFQLAFDPSGNAYAATNDGLWRFAAGGSSWSEVLAPAGEPQFPPYANQATSVAVVPGSGGADVIAAIGWRSTAFPTNGFYESTDGGNTFLPVTLSGAINASDIGRTTFAYAADGSKLYATVEAPSTVALQGIFVSTGTPASVAGPWTKVADGPKLASSGAAGFFGVPGEQSWYNQDLAVDPTDPNHVYAGLEEVYQSNDGGNTWVTASPYWNYSYACDATTPTTCPNTTHPDQHAMMITDNQIVIGNDGGVYSRPLSDANQNDGTWQDLNATLHSLQYYDARAGNVPGKGVSVWGGLQDNGTSVLTSGASQMAEPAGGDGFDVIVDPQNGNNMVGEYTNGTLYSSTDGGHSFADFVSPTCAAQDVTGLPGGRRSDCDPGARFVTPIAPDASNKNVWLLGGQDVWLTRSGWRTSCVQTSCSWKNVYDTGAGNATTAVASTGGGKVIYAAWVGGGGNPGPSFAVGIATNYGGTWHQLTMSGLPNRYIAGITVDPKRTAHAYAVFNGYSRRWIPGGGVGHVFETLNGGKSWTNISGNLPDIASDALLLQGGKLALATDAGVFTAAAGKGAGTTWSVLGTGLPNMSVNDLTPGPNGYIYAGTHGRGIWRFPF